MICTGFQSGHLGVQLAYKCLRDLAPAHLSSLNQPISYSSRRLRLRLAVLYRSPSSVEYTVVVNFIVFAVFFLAVLVLLCYMCVCHVVNTRSSAIADKPARRLSRFAFQVK